MRPERMFKLTLLCRSDDAHEVIEQLAAKRAVHVTDHQRETIGNAVVDIGRPFAHAEDISGSLTATRALLSKLPKTTAKVQIPNPELVARIRMIQDIAATCSVHEEAQQTAEREQQHTAQQLELLNLLPHDIVIDGLAQSRTIESMLVIENKRSDHGLLAKLSPLLILPNTERNTLLLTFHKKDAQKSRDALAAGGFVFVDLKPILSLEGTKLQAIAHVQQLRADAASRHNNAANAIAKLADHRAFLEASEEILSVALLKAQAPLHFAVTKNLTIIRGFVPQRSVASLESLPQPNVIDLAHADDAPILLDNPKGANNFEALVRLYTLPRYNEIDPTNLLAITFPLFFGFMLGDIGYGLCALALFAGLRYAYPSTKQFANILIISALATIAFGFLYGEVFGFEHIFSIELHPILHRTHDVMTMLGIALLIALFHINFGLILGMYNERKDGIAFAVGKKGSWMVLQAAFILIIVSFKEHIKVVQQIPYLSAWNIDIVTAVTVFVIALAGIWYFEGVLHLVEIFSILSNVMSYTRLAAVGLASVYLALVVNDIGASMFAKGGVWIAVGVIILIVGHTINLVLGLLGPFLHSLRLHYVEFFTKFYEGGGKPYKPFGVVEASA